MATNFKARNWPREIQYPYIPEERVNANLSFSSDPSLYTPYAMVTNVRARKWPRVIQYRYIPEEIVHSVLENLPIKSLLRFRCVSKQWSRAIRERKNRKKLLVLSSHSSESRFFGVIDEKTAQLEVIDVPPPWSDASCVNIYGSCNGLLLMGIGNNLYLWNQSIRCYSHVSSYDVDCDYRENYRVAIAGLCYDSRSDEYKAVLAWKHTSPLYGAQDIEVCSVKHKSWKTIKEFPYDLESGQPGPAMNDCLHWVVSAIVEDDNFFAPQLIVYFEAKTDKFGKFPMPDAPEGKEGNRILGLGVLDGCLSMVLCEESAIYKFPVQILSMKEYGVKESWAILFRIKDIHYSNELVPCFYTGEGNKDIIMTAESYRHERSISVYKPNDASFIKNIAPLLKYGSAIVYEETSVIPT